MAMLTLEEIENISFRRSGLGGYRIEDVDSFVDGVIEKVKSLELAKRELELRVEQLNTRIQKYEENAQSVQDAIITAEITAKNLVRDATQKAEAVLSEARQKAEQLESESKMNAENALLESQTRAETILNSALSRSASSIDENNRIIEQQKQHIIQIQSEVTRFREALIDSYKSHLKIINSLPKAEEFRQYQEKLEESYPPAYPVTPGSIGEDVIREADEAVEAAKRDRRRITVEMVDSDKVKHISEEIRNNTRGQEAMGITGNGSEAVSQDTDAALSPDAPEVSSAENYDNSDSNAQDIEAVTISDVSTSIVEEEPKPVSIDEIGDGAVFRDSEPERDNRSSQNKRQPIRLDQKKKGRKLDL